MLLDSSTIVEVFRSASTSRRFKRVMTEIDDEDVFISTVQLAEIADWAARNRVPPRERIEYVKEFARIVQLDERICLDASEIKQQRRRKGFTDFGILDGIILATARSMGQRVLTFDRDFEDENDCIVIS